MTDTLCLKPLGISRICLAKVGSLSDQMSSTWRENQWNGGTKCIRGTSDQIKWYPTPTRAISNEPIMSCYKWHSNTKTCLSEQMKWAGLMRSENKRVQHSTTLYNGPFGVLIFSSSIETQYLLLTIRTGPTIFQLLYYKRFCCIDG